MIKPTYLGSLLGKYCLDRIRAVQSSQVLYRKIQIETYTNTNISPGALKLLSATPYENGVLRSAQDEKTPVEPSMATTSRIRVII